MGLNIIIPLVLLAIAVPLALTWAKKSLKDAPSRLDDAPVTAPSARLTSSALRELPFPPWRVVHEIAQDKLNGIDHVLIGPAGIFAVSTSLDSLPDAPSAPPDAHDVAQAAIKRGALDDALARCAISSDRLVQVYWGATSAANALSTDPLPGVSAVDGRSLTTWVTALEGGVLTAAQIDLAWQTVITAIGRPDPLR